MGVEEESHTDLQSPDPIADVFDAMLVHEQVMKAVAKYADVKPNQLRRVLFRLADQPDEVWPKDSDEQYAQRFITLAGLPDIFTLIDDWSASLDYACIEADALLNGVPPATILPTLSLPEGEDREEVLIQAWDEGWDAVQTEIAVRAMWDTLDVPAELLAAMDGFKAALSDPALVHGSARYASLRRGLFEIELVCREFLQARSRINWAQRHSEEFEDDS